MIDDLAAANSQADPAAQPTADAEKQSAEATTTGSGGELNLAASRESSASADNGAGVSDAWRHSPVFNFFDALEAKGVSSDFVQRDAWVAVGGWFLGRIETAKALIADRALHDANRKHDFLATVAEVVNAAKSAIANNDAPEALLADLKLMDDSDLAWFAVVIMKGAAR